MKRKQTNKLEPQAVPCFYVGPSLNRPRDSMRVIFSSGTMIDSPDVTWARIHRLASVLCEQGGQEPTELQDMESVEGETSPSDCVSNELQSDRQKSTGDEEDGDDEESIFPLIVDPAPTREAAPVGRAATEANSNPSRSKVPKGPTIRALASGDRTLMPAPYRPHQGRTPMAPCLRLCWAGGKRAGSSGQWQVQLARSKGARVEIFADFRPSKTLVSLLERLVRYLRVKRKLVLHREN